MALEKEDLRQIKVIVTEAVEETVEKTVERAVEKVVAPYFNAIQKDFGNVYERLDRIENLIDNDYKQRIEKLEDQIIQLRNLRAA
ncbi:MAG: hypothetical protein Q8P39_00310 [Candidatus Yanofskybacteria bacterium]|nr:hypothetical protein [Candidatus Yanofskybacteria bacterium]